MKLPWQLLPLAFLLVPPVQAQEPEAATDKVCELGRYEGWTEERFDSYALSSEYVVAGGQKLAVDVYRPAIDGAATEEALPVLWTYSRYQRASMVGPSRFSTAMFTPWIQAAIHHGYVVVMADMRGCGASFGTWKGLFADDELRDTHALSEWIAEQPWCDGNVGMFGGSYLGITQYLAAGTKPEGLKAIFPEMAMFDEYETMCAGGILRHDLLIQWGKVVKALDGNGLSEDMPTGPWGNMNAAPVDGDLDQTILAAAIEDHAGNRDVVELMRPLAFRDDFDETAGVRPHVDWTPYRVLGGINESGVTAYHLVGWFDVFTRDAFLWYANLDVPQKLVIGPWSHAQNHGLDYTAEHLRFYDHVLKGVDNGVMGEAPIHYWLMGAPKGETWMSTWTWPLENERPTAFYFRAGPSESVDSANDGTLGVARPTDAGGDEVVVDYEATSGKPSRWSNAYGDGGILFDYGDMIEMDERGLTYTTMPLDEDLVLTGHPMADLWLTATADDVDVFVFLEEVDAQGKSSYVSEGSLRASHRALAEAPYDRLGLPYHSHRAEDVEPLPAGEPARLLFDLHPTANVFDAGHRLRVTITFADALNVETPRLDPPPTVTILRGGEHASHVRLPVIPQEE
ncbi:MAG: CocE/NonD family hydrolase [Planctomycetota bacterium]|nr:CocE/NonD family hydrolase [Planctomycetota bacterium]